MTGPALISERTAAELNAVAEFFGIDLEWNRHIFRHAAQVDGQAFAVVVRALAQAVQQDSRYGITDRIRAQMQKEISRK